VIREAIRLVEVQVRVPNIDWSVSDEWALRSLFEKCVVDGELFLSVVDLALKVIPKEEQSPREHLDNLLRLGGSALTIAPDGLSLVGRVQPEALQAARHVVEAGSRAGEYLAEAWRHAYGRNPHAGTAYREAVRAIEAAVCPVIIPKNPKPTLEVRKIREALAPNTSGAYTWKCKVCGFVNQGMVDAPL